MLNHYLSSVTTNYANFSGRTRRKEFFSFLLVNSIIYLCIVVLDGIFGLLDSDAGVGVLSSLYSIAVLVPGTAAGIRRLHDTGRSGWWVLINFVPFGPIVYLYWMFSDSDSEPNKWGPNPKSTGASNQTMNLKY